MGLLREFREFALRGNVLDLAVGVIIGGAFGKIVTSLVNDVLMPPIGALLGGVDFSAKKIVIQEAIAEATSAAGQAVAAKPEVAIYYGKFINASIDFLIVAACIFLVVKLFNEARKRFEAQKPAAAPPGPSDEVKLLGEIRDLLKTR